MRVVQLTPPGSGCSITIGPRPNDAKPGSLKGLQLVGEDVEAAQKELRDRGVDVSPVRHVENGQWAEGPGGVAPHRPQPLPFRVSRWRAVHSARHPADVSPGSLELAVFPRRRPESAPTPAATISPYSGPAIILAILPACSGYLVTRPSRVPSFH
jgi:hypothetical protein